MKKLLSLVLALAIGVIPVAAYADDAPAVAVASANPIQFLKKGYIDNTKRCKIQQGSN